MRCNSDKIKVLRDLYWIILRIFSRDPKSKVIITGDFNKNNLDTYKMSKYNMRPILDEKVSAHNMGN